jgi:hypothetical protein
MFRPRRAFSCGEVAMTRPLGGGVAGAAVHIDAPSHPRYGTHLSLDGPGLGVSEEWLKMGVTWTTARLLQHGGERFTSRLELGRA